VSRRDSTTSFRIVVAARCGERSQRVPAHAQRVVVNTLAILCWLLLCWLLLWRLHNLCRVPSVCGVCSTSRGFDGLDLRCVLVALGETDAGGQVAEANGHTVLTRPHQRLPLGGEHRERPERRNAGRIGDVSKQRDGRYETGVGDQGGHRVSVGGAFDEDNVRLQPFQRRPDRARGTRTVVAHPENLHDGSPTGSPTNIGADTGADTGPGIGDCMSIEGCAGFNARGGLVPFDVAALMSRVFVSRVFVSRAVARGARGHPLTSRQAR
jgi:hypothetical protein